MVLQKLKDLKIILGSQSPRRSELLKSMGIAFDVEVKEVDESFDPALMQQDVALAIAHRKSEAFRHSSYFEQLVITADTIVVDKNGHPLGKPHDKTEAFQVLQCLSDEIHAVYTAVVLLYQGKVYSFTEETKVWFAPLSDEEISYYIDTFKPYDKAGAYGIQEWIGRVAIKKIEGAYENVVGLPTARLYQELKKIFK